MGLFSGLFNSTKDQFEDIETSEFDSLYAKTKGKYLLDVRSRSEFQDEKIPNAMNIDILHPDFMDRVSQLNPEKTIFIYCQSGKRSKKAARRMTKAGFTQIITLKGGLNNYEGKTV